jgi:hypothetical protein
MFERGSNWYCQTPLSSRSRETTSPGRLARKVRTANSRAERDTQRPPPTVALRLWGSSSIGTEAATLAGPLATRRCTRTRATSSSNEKGFAR